MARLDDDKLPSVEPHMRRLLEALVALVLAAVTAFYWFVA
jgi:hypothetical protein